MPTPWVPIKRCEALYHASPQGIQVQVAHEFEEVRFLLNQHRFVPTLDERADAAVSPIERTGIARHQLPHGC
jgi:hypothetical protein